MSCRRTRSSPGAVAAIRRDRLWEAGVCYFVVSRPGVNGVLVVAV